MPRTIFQNIVVQDFRETLSIAFCQYTAIRFFEILLIEKGSGKLNINGHSVPYQGHQIFIFIPNDKYNFEIETPTTVSAIKFLNSYFKNFSVSDHSGPQKEWLKKIETILHSTDRVSHIELSSEIEESSFAALFTVLSNEFNHQHLDSKPILKATLHSILHILSRNVQVNIAQKKSSKIQEIVNYIHYHIHNSDQLSNKTIASEFNLSETYIGEYFKKQMGISLKKYILQHKVKLAETRLKHTDLSLSEIAIELGFTDSSHLDKTFLSYKGMTANHYRLGKK